MSAIIQYLNTKPARMPSYEENVLNFLSIDVIQITFIVLTSATHAELQMIYKELGLSEAKV